MELPRKNFRFILTFLFFFFSYPKLKTHLYTNFGMLQFKLRFFKISNLVYLDGYILCFSFES